MLAELKVPWKFGPAASQICPEKMGFSILDGSSLMLLCCFVVVGILLGFCHMSQKPVVTDVYFDRIVLNGEHYQLVAAALLNQVILSERPAYWIGLGEAHKMLVKVRKDIDAKREADLIPAWCYSALPMVPSLETLLALTVPAVPRQNGVTVVVSGQTVQFPLDYSQGLVVAHYFPKQLGPDYQYRTDGCKFWGELKKFLKNDKVFYSLICAERLCFMMTSKRSDCNEADIRSELSSIQESYVTALGKMVMPDMKSLSIGDDNIRSKMPTEVQGTFNEEALFHLECAYGSKLKSGPVNKTNMNLYSRHMLRLQYGGKLPTADDARIKSSGSWEVWRNYSWYKKTLDDHEDHMKYYKVNISVSISIFNQT